ncbi:hypothetical protein [Staphylococcus arlettae]|uniref:hypothetical protein n=1 Tax=Staphylococcus arlettae TaxID=29378 RepID=UPI003EE0DF9B
MLDESNYVTHNHLNERERKMYRYIDKGDQELKDLYHTLDKKLELDQQRGEQTIKQQEKMIEGINNINDNLTGFDKRVTKIEDQTKSNTTDIKAIKATTEDKKKGTREVWIAIISATGVVVAAAFGFAQIFF